MTIVGFNFDKIEIERISNSSGKINVKHNIGIKDVFEEKKSPFGKENDIIKVTFEYGVEYEPSIGHIMLNGHLLYLESPDKIKGILKTWKADKKLPDNILQTFLNSIFSRCNIKALTLSQEVNLPPHIPLPKLKTKKEEDSDEVKKYIG